MGSPKSGERNSTQPQANESVKSTVVNQREEILNDARNTARENWVSKMREEFRNKGVEASISELDGELIIVSDVLKLKPDRDRLMRSTFDPAYRKALCELGFRTVELKSQIVFGDGDSYSLGCPETKEERDERLAAQRGQRQAFVAQLQQSLNSDSEIGGDFRVEQGTNELILTSPSAKDVPPKMFDSMFAAEFGDGSDSKMCSLGFRGFRVRASASSSGISLPFNCGKSIPDPSTLTIP